MAKVSALGAPQCATPDGPAKRGRLPGCGVTSGLRGSGLGTLHPKPFDLEAAWAELPAHQAGKQPLRSRPAGLVASITQLRSVASNACAKSIKA